MLILDRNSVEAPANIGRCKIYVGPLEEAIPLLKQCRGHGSSQSKTMVPRATHRPASRRNLPLSRRTGKFADQVVEVDLLLEMEIGEARETMLGRTEP